MELLGLGSRQFKAQSKALIKGALIKGLGNLLRLLIL